MRFAAIKFAVTLLFVDDDGTWDTGAWITQLPLSKVSSAASTFPRGIQHFTPTLVTLVVEQKLDGSFVHVFFWGQRSMVISLRPEFLAWLTL